MPAVGRPVRWHRAVRIRQNRALYCFRQDGIFLPAAAGTLLVKLGHALSNIPVNDPLSVRRPGYRSVHRWPEGKARRAAARDIGQPYVYVAEFGIHQRRSQLLFVRGQPEVGIVALGRHRTEVFPIAVKPGKVGGVQDRARVRKHPRGAGGKGAVAQAGMAHPLGNCKWLAAELKPAGVESPCKQHVAVGIKQIAWRCVSGAGVDGYQQFLGFSVKRAGVNATIFRSGASNEVKKMTAIGQEMRPAVRPFLSR